MHSYSRDVLCVSICCLRLRNDLEQTPHFSISKIFGFLDQDGNGVIEVDDLVALHGIMGEDSLPFSYQPSGSFGALSWGADLS